MELEAIRFFGYPSTDTPCPFILKFESSGDLLRIREATRLGALLLRDCDTNLLCEYGDAVRNKGSKHPSKGLPAHLLSNRKTSPDPRMPLLVCDYQEAGRVTSSIDGLLKRAAKCGERNTFLIGVNSDLFEEVRRGLVSKQRSVNEEKSATESHCDLSWSKEMLKLLHIKKVPEEVSSRYLGTSDDVQLVHQMILLASRIAEPVLIVGESGTGKELVAWSIHEQSTRRDGPFRAVNCGAIPSELLESELFGTTKSAYTGSAEKEGIWKQAHGGTLFLDEIADLAPNHQVKILRTMQEKMIRRVGAVEEEKVDTRIITATNRNLGKMVLAGQFREDLFYRIHGFVIYTPALRSHPEDIPQMAVKFWASITRNDSRSLSSEVLEELKGRRWLGNGRELKMFLSSLYGLFGDQTITLRHLWVVDGHPGMQGLRGGKLAVAQELNLRHMDQLRHHRKLLEVLSSLKTSLRPVLVENMIDLRTTTLARVVLQSYMEKLASLAVQTDMFSSSTTRSSVEELVGSLRDFARELEAKASGARKYWDTHVQSRFKNADSACFAEVQKLLEAVEK